MSYREKVQRRIDRNVREINENRHVLLDELERRGRPRPRVFKRNRSQGGSATRITRNILSFLADSVPQLREKAISRGYPRYLNPELIRECEEADTTDLELFLLTSKYGNIIETLLNDHELITWTKMSSTYHPIIRSIINEQGNVIDAMLEEINNKVDQIKPLGEFFTSTWNAAQEKKKKKLSIEKVFLEILREALETWNEAMENSRSRFGKGAKRKHKKKTGTSMRRTGTSMRRTPKAVGYIVRRGKGGRKSIVKVVNRKGKDGRLRHMVRAPRGGAMVSLRKGKRVFKTKAAAKKNL
jgi:hypothetical protein